MCRRSTRTVLYSVYSHEEVSFDRYARHSGSHLRFQGSYGVFRSDRPCAEDRSRQGSRAVRGASGGTRGRMNEDVHVTEI